MNNAYRYIVQNNGLNTEKVYSYSGNVWYEENIIKLIDLFKFRLEDVDIVQAKSLKFKFLAFPKFPKETSKLWSKR